VTRILWQAYVDPEQAAPFMTRLPGWLAEIAAPGTEIEVRGLRPGDAHLHRISELRCGAQIVAALIEADREGFDAGVVAHFQDSSLWEARAAVEMPVVGLGEAAMLHACGLGARVGLVTIDRAFVRWHEEQVLRSRLEARCVGVEALDVPLPAYFAAFEDAEARGRIRDAFAARAQALADAGAEVVIPADSMLGLLLRGERDFAVGGAVVLNATPVAVMHAEMAARLRALNGTGTSRHSTFARPDADALRAYVEQLGRHDVAVGD
jgi:Asp/Glu/hydantoin racemase